MAHPIAHDGRIKFCGACEEYRPLEDFALRSGRGGGRQSACKDCRKAMYDLWYAAHKDEQTQRTRDNYDPTKAREYRAANKARELAYAAQYRIEHPGRVVQWEHENPERARELGHRKTLNYRARKRAQFVESVDPMIVYTRDEGICGICDQPVDRDDFHVDHVIPIVRGGEHSYANTQVAHPLCNSRKGAS